MARVWKVIDIIGISICFTGVFASCVQYEPVNKMPHITEFLISPSKPTSEEALNVDWICPVTDPNRWDHLKIEIQWFHNGCEVSVDEPQTFPAWRTRRGDIIDLEIRTWDGNTRSMLVAHSVVISNSLPHIEVDFFPTDPKAGEDIYVDWWAFDTDGDSLEVSWNWLYNDVVVPIEEQNFPKNITKRGDQIGVRFQIFDGMETIREEFYVDVE